MQFSATDMNLRPGGSNPGQTYKWYTGTPVSSKGSIAFKYSTMLFPNTSNAGPVPYPNKWLVGFDRLLSIALGSSSTLTIPVSIDAISRVDSLSNGVLYPSQYELALNNERSAVLSFTLIGNATMLAKWPLDKRQISPYSVRA
jgi:beta-D-xylosidase 4